MESGVKSRVRVGFGCHSLGFGSGSGVTSPGLGRVRVLFVGFRVFSGFFGFQKMDKMYLKFVLSSKILVPYFLQNILHKIVA